MPGSEGEVGPIYWSLFGIQADLNGAIILMQNENLVLAVNIKACAVSNIAICMRYFIELEKRVLDSDR